MHGRDGHVTMSSYRGTLILRRRKMFDAFLSKATALRSAECPFAVAVVVRGQAPVSGKPGDKAIIQPDGSVWGWIGGGCVQPVVIQEAQKAIEDGSPRLIRIAPSRGSESEEGIMNYTMTCHGGVHWMCTSSRFCLSRRS